MKPLKMREVEVLDRNSGFLGVSPAELMERAGRKAAEKALEFVRFGPGGDPHTRDRDTRENGAAGLAEQRRAGPAEANGEAGGPNGRDGDGGNGPSEGANADGGKSAPARGIGGVGSSVNGISNAVGPGGLFDRTPAAAIPAAGRTYPANAYDEAHAPRRHRSAVIMCGTGNNGGDGFVMARHLRKDFLTSVVLVGHPSQIKSSIARDNFNKIPDPVEVLELPGNSTQKQWNEVLLRLESADLVVDAMLGVGARGELREPYKRCARSVNAAQTNSVVISVDVPTGLGTADAVLPRMTVTFHAVKEGMDESGCGIIEVVDIGIPPKAGTHTGPGELVYYPIPRRGSHKGQNGVLMVVGGGPYTGAPALCALAALCTGADLVHVAVPGRIAETITHYSPDLIVHPVGSRNSARFDNKAGDAVLKLAEAYCVDAMVIGPGMGDTHATQSVVSKLIKKLERPMVLDADAFGVFTGRFKSTTLSALPGRTGVVTPHVGEFLKLTGDDVASLDFADRVDRARSWADVFKWTVLLKGSVDIITDGDDVRRCDLGNDAMTVGGTGDVLAGVVGALLAKGASPFNAARMATFLTNRAGDLVFSERSYGLRATEVLEAIPGVLAAHL